VLVLFLFILSWDPLHSREIFLSTSFSTHHFPDLGFIVSFRYVKQGIRHRLRRSLSPPTQKGKIAVPGLGFPRVTQELTLSASFPPCFLENIHICLPEVNDPAPTRFSLDRNIATPTHIFKSLVFHTS
jgi:hypothetical protein